jgi:hypothetical protein
MTNIHSKELSNETSDGLKTIHIFTRNKSSNHQSEHGVNTQYARLQSQIDNFGVSIHKSGVASKMTFN